MTSDDTSGAAEHHLNVGARYLSAPHLRHPERVVNRKDTLLLRPEACTGLAVAPPESSSAARTLEGPVPRMNGISSSGRSLNVSWRNRFHCDSCIQYPSEFGSKLASSRQMNRMAGSLTLRARAEAPGNTRTSAYSTACALYFWRLSLALRDPISVPRPNQEPGTSISTDRLTCCWPG